MIYFILVKVFECLGLTFGLAGVILGVFPLYKLLAAAGEVLGATAEILAYNFDRETRQKLGTRRSTPRWVLWGVLKVSATLLPPFAVYLGTRFPNSSAIKYIALGCELVYIVSKIIGADFPRPYTLHILVLTILLESPAAILKLWDDQVPFKFAAMALKIVSIFIAFLYVLLGPH